MEYFVAEKSVVRKIWGNADTILFIFAGAAAEFALNKAVDWLYFTGKLPANPLGRMFSTVAYARKIVFSSIHDAHKAIDTLQHIHSAVEKGRRAVIPDWAYRDVLFMLLHYSIAAYEQLEATLTEPEKEEIYNVFYRLGCRMGLKELPDTYNDWLPVREAHLLNDLQVSTYTKDLFKQYKKHLGPMRYRVLIEAQKLVVPDRVKAMLQFSNFSLVTPILPLYKLSKLMKMDSLLKNILVPGEYQEAVKELDKIKN